jgi:hypothetical protein
MTTREVVSAVVTVGLLDAAAILELTARVIRFRIIEVRVKMVSVRAF